MIVGGIDKRDVEQGEGEHVGRFVFATIFAVERAQAVVVGEQEAELDGRGDGDAGECERDDAAQVGVVQPEDGLIERFGRLVGDGEDEGFFDAARILRQVGSVG